MIYLTKNGFRKTEWDGEIRQDVDVPIKSMLRELRYGCEIEEGTTLGDIFSAVERDPLLMAILGEWAWCDCEAFHKEMNKPALPTDLKWIEISRTAEIQKDGEMSFGLDVGGRDDSDTRWAIDFTPINELKNVPVKLAKDFTLWDWRPEDPIKTELKADFFSVLDVLGELYYEVSFHGPPSNRNDFANNLKTMVDEIRSGEAEIVPHEIRKDTVQ